MSPRRMGSSLQRSRHASTLYTNTGHKSLTNEDGGIASRKIRSFSLRIRRGRSHIGCHQSQDEGSRARTSRTDIGDASRHANPSARQRSLHSLRGSVKTVKGAGNAAPDHDLPRARTSANNIISLFTRAQEDDCPDGTSIFDMDRRDRRCSRHDLPLSDEAGCRSGCQIQTESRRTPTSTSWIKNHFTLFDGFGNFKFHALQRPQSAIPFTPKTKTGGGSLSKSWRSITATWKLRKQHQQQHQQEAKHDFDAAICKHSECRRFAKDGLPPSSDETPTFQLFSPTGRTSGMEAEFKQNDGDGCQRDICKCRCCNFDLKAPSLWPDQLSGSRKAAQWQSNFSLHKKSLELQVELPDASDASPSAQATASTVGRSRIRDGYASLASRHLNRDTTSTDRTHVPLSVGSTTALVGFSSNPFLRISATPSLQVTSDQHPPISKQSHESSIDIYQPHPFGVWHINRDGPTSLPIPPKRSASTSFVRPASGLGQPRKHTRNAHSLGTLPDLSAANLSSRISSSTQRSSLGYTDVRTSGFPFIMPESETEATNSPASERVSELGSLRRFDALSDAGSAVMSRTHSDRPSIRSYEESSVSAKGPGATINRTAGEHLGSSLREHFSPSPQLAPSTSSHQDDLLSVVEHRGAPTSRDAELSQEHESASPAADETETPVVRPASSNAFSSETAGSSIMKMRAPSTATPSLRDFPVNADANPSSEAVQAPTRQRTDSRPTISPSSTSRAISTPAPMPLPQALQDLRPTVRRAQGQRAESELVHTRKSSKPFNFPARSSAQYDSLSSKERADILQARPTQAKSGGFFIRRLIRRASLKGNKSHSVGGTASGILSPTKSSVAVPSELEIEDSSNVASTPRNATSTSNFPPVETKPLTLTRRLSKSKEAGSTKHQKASSLFAPFLARNPSKNGGSGRFRNDRKESFGHLGPLPPDDPPFFPRDGLPFSASTPFLGRNSDSEGLTRASLNGVRGQDIAGGQRSLELSHNDQVAESQRNSRLTNAAELSADEKSTQDQSHLSHPTDQTDKGPSMSPAAPDSPKFEMRDSLNNQGRDRSADTGPEPFASNGTESSAPSAGLFSAKEGHSRPRAGIPRIWQGLESIDGDHMMRSTHIDDVEDSNDTPPEHYVPANRFDTVTTVSSFRTAASQLDSPKSTTARRQNNASTASKLSLRTLDTPLARHLDTGSRQASPLADLINNLERRLSIPSTLGTRGSAHFHDAADSPGSEFLPLEPESNRPAIAAGPSPSPSIDGRGTQRSYHDFDDDDDASIRAIPHQTHVPAVSHTALVETVSPSHQTSFLDPVSPTSPVSREAGTSHWNKRDTFGGLESIPLVVSASQQSEVVSDTSRTQLSHPSTATAGPDHGHHQFDQHEGDDSEHKEVVVPEVKVSEIESHLEAVEAALQHNREEGSFDPTSLRQRMSDASYALHPNGSSVSMLSREGSLPHAQRAADISTDDLPLPGAWTQDSSSFVMSDDGRRITLAPESHEALADAVRSVRRAISSSQLTDTEESRTALANRSVETLGMESFVSEAAEPAGEKTMMGDVSVLSEATPARAARRRQEGMRDIEEAYGRMLALVQSSAIGVTPSPQMRPEEGRLGVEPPRRPMKQGAAASGVNEPFFNSPLAKSSTKTDEPLSQLSQPKRSIADEPDVNQPARSQGRALSNAEKRTSTSLSGLMGMPLDINPQMLRHASTSSVSSAQDFRNEFIEGGATRRRAPSVAKSSSSRYSQALSRDHVASSLLDSDLSRKRFSTDNTTVGRASSGGGHTSPSATAKTLGTPRSFATSVSQPSIAHMVRRHELEKESLLDTLERVRAENADLHARHESLTSDLHAEVTRVLELERELERRDSREVTLIGQIQDLENELMELRYLDHQLNSTADQTLGSEDGEGSIMDVELPPTLSSAARMGAAAYSPRAKDDQVSSTPSSASKFKHRSTRSEAFVAGLPGSAGRSTLLTSRSELPRARPVSLLNGPGGLYRDERGSERSSQASPLTTPRSSSLLREHLREQRAKAKAATTQQASPTLLGISLPKEENEAWNIADERLPEIEDEFDPASEPKADSYGANASRRRRDSHERAYDDEHQRNSFVHAAAPDVAEASPQDSSLMPRSSSQVTVTKNTAATPSKIPASRSVSDSFASRLPRLGLKPSTRYSTGGTTGGIRTVSGATDKSTGSTLSSVYSNGSAINPPSLGSVPSGNNTMEDEIQAELARLGNPQPHFRYYSPPRSKMI